MERLNFRAIRGGRSGRCSRRWATQSRNSPITSKNLIYHELIGLAVRVVRSSNPCMNGMEGEVVDETMKMLVVDTGGRDVKIPKSICVFEFTLPSGEKVMIDGKKIVGRPEDRVKRAK